MSSPEVSRLVATLSTIADGLSYQAECRPRPSKSREALWAAVADIFDAIQAIEDEDVGEQ